ncbi:MAG TPA: glycoside hydrolase family 15 protein [Steroidobacteraceae bacterium]
MTAVGSLAFTGSFPRIEDYALIGNAESVALVGRNGSIDWMCLPRFDSGAGFFALLGRPEHGRWLIAPAAPPIRISRAYRDGTVILETLFETATGCAVVIDFMAHRGRVSDLGRIVRGVQGTVTMNTELTIGFDYGCLAPWISRRRDGGLQFTAGPDRFLVHTAVELRSEPSGVIGEFQVHAGEEVSFSLSWSPSYCRAPRPVRPAETLAKAHSFWSQWIRKARVDGPWSDAARRSLLTLKAFAHRETGGIVAAATTSLPEKIAGTRNWDYRFCWLRDATFALYAFLGAGLRDEANGWREWLIRAVGGSPEMLQVAYGVAGERRLREYEAAWLPGYAGSQPVRIGNAAAKQLQIDVYGEVIDALYVARKAGLAPKAASWALECGLLGHLEKIWQTADEGIWEVRGGPRHFTHSKVMAWVAFDRAARSVLEFHLEGPLERWQAVRDTIHAQVCERGFDKTQNSFVQAYGSPELDASLLLLPLVGFLPPDDSRIRGTLAAIEGSLIHKGLCRRYQSQTGIDGLAPGEGAFLACSFWLADNYVLQGRFDDARALFERLLGLRNDVGLMAEEYDPQERRQLGNFPQVLAHLALINTARNLAGAGPAHDRSAGSKRP